MKRENIQIPELFKSFTALFPFSFGDNTPIFCEQEGPEEKKGIESMVRRGEKLKEEKAKRQAILEFFEQ